MRHNRQWIVQTGTFVAELIEGSDIVEGSDLRDRCICPYWSSHRVSLEPYMSWWVLPLAALWLLIWTMVFAPNKKLLSCMCLHEKMSALEESANNFAENRALALPKNRQSTSACGRQFHQINLSFSFTSEKCLIVLGQGRSWSIWTCVYLLTGTGQ